MKPASLLAQRHFVRQYGVITRMQALKAGMTGDQVTRAVASGSWTRVHAGVYRLAGYPPSPQSVLLAACLATGGVASHQSAAWLWGLLPTPPEVPSVSVEPSRSGHRPGVVVHRVDDLRPSRQPRLQGIPCTNPVRTVSDLAAMVGGPRLREAIDRGLAAKRFTVAQLIDELAWRAGRGRRGVGILRSALACRGYIGAPNPSVLESRVLRLLARGGIQPRGVEVEVVGRDGLYRLDITLAERLAMEVDGFAYHFSVDAMSRDNHRRNELTCLGWTVLVFSWRDVTHRGDRVLRIVQELLAMQS